jgi:hypothetical protein
MPNVHQLKIELAGSHPLVWRRILVKSDYTFEELHDIIQLTMGWENDHLYEFTVNNVKVHDFENEMDTGENPDERDCLDTFLDELVNMEKTTFTYLYDFGDHWEHTVVLEKILNEGEGMKYPVCTDGERACPPEDSGGIWGYQNMLQALSDQDHPDHEDLNEWIGENWDPGFFNIKKVNASLLDYARQWEEIYDETGKFLEQVEKKIEVGIEDAIYDPEENDEHEYERHKHLTSPQDLLNDELEKLEIEAYIEDAVREKNTSEQKTLTRLLDLGYDNEKAKSLIRDCLSIEWFYDGKYGTDHLDERYEHNLNHLPEIPLEIPGLEHAIQVLDNCTKGIPFKAIEFLYNEPSEAAASAIIRALENHSDHQYCWGNCVTAPLWYALAAEGHLREELIDPVIQLYKENDNESDLLHEQGEYLIGKLAQKYPDLTVRKVLEAMEKDIENESETYLYYLFDVFHFCEIDNYKAQLLALMEHDHTSWRDSLAATFAELQIKEGLPVLKRQLKAIRKKANVKSYETIEIEEAIEQLEKGEVFDPDIVIPLCLKRPGWKEEFEGKEGMFYDDWADPEDIIRTFDPDLFPSEQPTVNWPHYRNEPFAKEKTPGRNDLCPCGSGKKYKKCCLNKDLGLKA